MNNELISVIMPVFNAGNYIVDSINSILHQTYKNFEFIIVDDGSTDDSVIKIKEINDARISFYDRGKEGLINQLNFALSKARGKYIARMDADDLCDVTRFERQVEFLETNRDIHLVGSNYYYIDKSGKIIIEKKFPKKHEDIEFMMPITASVLHSSMLVLRENLVKVNGYDNSKIYAEDHDLFLRLIESGCRMYNLQIPLYYYRIGNESEASKFSHIQQKSVYDSGIAYLQMKYPSEQRSGFNYMYRTALLEYYRGDMDRARGILFKLLFSFPARIMSFYRYLIISLLGEKIIQTLRKKKILTKLSLLSNKFLNKDLNNIQKPENN